MHPFPITVLIMKAWPIRGMLIVCRVLELGIPVGRYCGEPQVSLKGSPLIITSLMREVEGLLERGPTSYARDRFTFSECPLCVAFVVVSAMANGTAIA